MFVVDRGDLGFGIWDLGFGLILTSNKAVILFEPKPNTQNLFVTKIRWLK